MIYANDYIYVCVYVSMSLCDRVVKDNACGGMIYYAIEWHAEVPGYKESSGREILINI